MTACLLLATPGWAGGLYVQEFGTPSQAMAGAGANALGDDASAAFHNPASMTRLEDHQFLAGMGGLIADIKFDPDSDTPFSGGSGDEQGGFGPILSSHYVHKLSDRWRAGLSVVSISAAVLDPSNDWAGRYQVTELDFITLSALPSLAVRVHDMLSVGVGANIVYGTMKFDVAVPLPGPNDGRVEFDWIDDVDAGVTASLFFEPTESTRLGIFWMDKIELDLDGDIKFRGGAASMDANVETKIPFVETVRAGLVHDWNSKLWTAASFRWEDWSDFDNQFIQINGLTSSIERDWKDTYGGSLGFGYRLDDRWTVLGGVGYDSSAVNTNHRTADLPIDQQVRVAFGFQRAWGEKRFFGGNFSYVWLGKSRIRSDTLAGDYERNQMFALTFYVGWKQLPWSSGK